VTDSPEWAAARDQAILRQLRDDMTAATSDPQTVAHNWLARLTAEGATMPEWWHVLKLAEETGEAVRAWLRVRGLAREHAEPAELAGELADVVITAYAVAELRGLDLPQAIGVKHAVLMTRDLGDLGGRARG
jgi:NTP pyrophosphatase (non-canonical NTP hydrolase)